jgi:hypothetical protein
MPKLKFYDVKGKKSFSTDKYKFTSKKTMAGMRYFAIADAPSGIQAWRIVSKVFWTENK